MRLGALFSGGKDSCFAIKKAMEDNELVCLINMVSENKESFMFHVPNIHIAELQAEAIGLPIIKVKTKGEKEKELLDLEKAISAAKKEYGIEGIVTGAVRSVYQATRIQKICKKLDLWCFNPLWLKDEISLLKEMVETMDILISGVFAYPLGEDILGTIIDDFVIEKLEEMKNKHKINPAGEGGELETTVLDSKIFKKRVNVIEFSKKYSNYSGTFDITKAELVKK